MDRGAWKATVHGVARSCMSEHGVAWVSNWAHMICQLLLSLPNLLQLTLFPPNPCLWPSLTGLDLRFIGTASVPWVDTHSHWKASPVLVTSLTYSLRLHVGIKSSRQSYLITHHPSLPLISPLNIMSVPILRHVSNCIMAFPSLCPWLDCKLFEGRGLVLLTSKSRPSKS